MHITLPAVQAIYDAPKLASINGQTAYTQGQVDSMLSLYEAERRWIPVEERPYPKVGSCLISTDRGIVASMANSCIHNEACNYRFGDKVTHWRGFPPPPTNIAP